MKLKRYAYVEPGVSNGLSIRGIIKLNSKDQVSNVRVRFGFDTTRVISEPICFPALPDSESLCYGFRQIVDIPGAMVSSFFRQSERADNWMLHTYVY